MLLSWGPCLASERAPLTAHCLAVKLHRFRKAATLLTAISCSSMRSQRMVRCYKLCGTGGGGIGQLWRQSSGGSLAYSQDVAVFCCGTRERTQAADSMQGGTISATCCAVIAMGLGAIGLGATP